MGQQLSNLGHMGVANAINKSGWTGLLSTKQTPTAHSGITPAAMALAAQKKAKPKSSILKSAIKGTPKIGGFF